MARIVILGAGLTGLSTAYHLEKSNFSDFKIFEKEQTHGGLARSVHHNGFTFDFTGHLLHCNNNYFRDFLDEFLPEPERNKILRNSFVYMHKHFVPYPFQMNLRGLPPEVISQCLVGFAKRKHHIKNPQNFHEWVLKHFGTGLAKHFFFPYHKKLLHPNIKKIHHSWTQNFVPKTTIKDIVDGLSERKDHHEVGYNHWFYYPKKNGIQQFTDNVRKKVAAPIHTDHKAVRVDFASKKVFFENGHVEPFETLITTLPLNNFLQISNEPTRSNLRKNRYRLLCNSVVNFNLGFTPSVHDDKHWLYIPERQYEFYRVGFWHNFSKNLVRKNCGALYGELAYQPGRLSLKAIKKRTDKAIEQACTVLGISKNSLVTKKILSIPHAYVVYDQWRHENLASLHEALGEYGIHSVGRYGAWKYSSMQDAILDGKAIATTVAAKQFVPAKIFELPQQKEEKILPSPQKTTGNEKQGGIQGE